MAFTNDFSHSNGCRIVTNWTICCDLISTIVHRYLQQWKYFLKHEKLTLSILFFKYYLYASTKSVRFFTLTEAPWKCIQINSWIVLMLALNKTLDDEKSQRIRFVFFARLIDDYFSVLITIPSRLASTKTQRKGK